MVDIAQFRQTFFEECDDCLAALEVQLMDFEAGRIAEIGRHDELLSAGKVYAGLWARQVGEVPPA